MVDCQRYALATDDLLQQQEVAVCIFLLTKETGDYFASGIVDGSDEGKVWATLLQSRVGAAIDLQEHAFLGVALPTTAMLGCSSLAWTLETNRS